MKILGIDIGTTTISAVVADSKNKEVIQAYTVENQSFLKSEKVWEKVQNPQSILEKTSALLENILNEYPDIKSIGLTGQMHGILYVDAQGKAVSPLYTWQDARGNQPLLKGKSLCQILQEDYGKKAYTRLRPDYPFVSVYDTENPKTGGQFLYYYGLSGNGAYRTKRSSGTHQ